MKSLIIIALGLFSCAYASAQSPAPEKGDTASQTPFENKVDVLFRNHDDMMAVRQEDLPAALRTTLGQSRYKGWEKGELLRSSDGTTYELRMGKSDKPKVYRFDAEGKPVED